MSRLGFVVASAAVLATSLVVGSGHADAATRRVSLGGVRVALHDGTRQVVTVNHTRGYHARVDFWVLRHGRWHRVYAVRDGRIGYGGLVAPRRRQQGTGTTPLGTTRLIASFGRHPRAVSWSLPYRRIQAGDFWVEDNRSQFYNRYRNQAQGGFRWWLPTGRANSSERLGDYPTPYEYSIVTSFNRDQVRHRGAGILLHVNGPGATAGCVSAPRSLLRHLMRRLAPDDVPVMAVGR